MANTQQMKSLSELEREGWSKELLYRISHMPNSPMFRTTPKGKFYVVEERLKEFVAARLIGK